LYGYGEVLVASTSSRASSVAVGSIGRAATSDERTAGPARLIDDELDPGAARPAPPTERSLSVAPTSAATSPNAEASRAGALPSALTSVRPKMNRGAMGEGSSMRDKELGRRSPTSGAPSRRSREAQSAARPQSAMKPSTQTLVEEIGLAPRHGTRNRRTRIAMKSTIRPEVWLSVQRAGLPPPATCHETRTHPRGRSERSYGPADASLRSPRRRSTGVTLDLGRDRRLDFVGLSTSESSGSSIW
jgi:hypothetical protein